MEMQRFINITTNIIIIIKLGYFISTLVRDCCEFRLVLFVLPKQRVTSLNACLRL